MKDLMANVIQRISSYWKNTSITQRMLISSLAVVAVSVFIGLIIWISKAEYGVLYANLGAEDANRVIKALEAQQVPYKLEENGSAILVPEGKVHGLRINIAGNNILTGKGIGFEIFNDIKVGQTDFVQKINYRRALEGELSRTISEFPAVDAARVHLVIPNPTLFLEEKQKPSASVLLKLAPGKKMENHDVQALVNLITMAVEGLEKSKVSIADANGRVLFQPEQEGSINELTQTQLDYKLHVQRNLENRIEELLMPIIGAGRVIAKVNADMDFSQKTIRREEFDPEKSVVRSEQRNEETTQGSGSIEGGTPDPNFRGDGFAGTTSTQTSNRETRTTNYDISKEETSIISTVGDINRLSVAVIVDGTYTKDESGKTTFVARTPEEMTRIRQLVANAVGYDTARGDTIEVSNIGFDGVDFGDNESVTAAIVDYASRFGKPLINACLVFLFLVLVVRPIVLALIRPKVEGKMLEGLEGLPQAEERLALVEGDDEAIAASAVLEKIEDIKAHALQLSEQNMDQALGIIKSWLKEPSSQSGGVVKAA